MKDEPVSKRECRIVGEPGPELVPRGGTATNRTYQLPDNWTDEDRVMLRDWLRGNQASTYVPIRSRIVVDGDRFRVAEFELDAEGKRFRRDGQVAWGERSYALRMPPDPSEWSRFMVPNESGPLWQPVTEVD